MNVSYIWSRGVQLYGVRDLNLPTTTTNFTYTINDVNGNAAGILYHSGVHGNSSGHPLRRRSTTTKTA